MIEYIATFLAGALITCIGVIVYMLRRANAVPSEPRGLDEPTNPESPPVLLPDYVERAERDADEMPDDPDPDDDNYVDDYIRNSKRLDE